MSSLATESGQQRVPARVKLKAPSKHVKSEDVAEPGGTYAILAQQFGHGDLLMRTISVAFAVFSGIAILATTRTQSGYGLQTADTEQEIRAVETTKLQDQLGPTRSADRVAIVQSVRDIPGPSPSVAIADDKGSPIYGVTIPCWIPAVGVGRSVPRSRQPRRVTRHSRKRFVDEGLSRRNASFPGRRDPCQAGLETRAVPRSRRSFRSRAHHDGSAHGQGLKKVCLNGRLGIRAIHRR